MEEEEKKREKKKKKKKTKETKKKKKGIIKHRPQRFWSLQFHNLFSLPWTFLDNTL
jgi:hypothetical protein